MNALSHPHSGLHTKLPPQIHQSTNVCFSLHTSPVAFAPLCPNHPKPPTAKSLQGAKRARSFAGKSPQSEMAAIMMPDQEHLGGTRSVKVDGISTWSRPGMIRTENMQLPGDRNMGTVLPVLNRVMSHFPRYLEFGSRWWILRTQRPDTGPTPRCSRNKAKGTNSTNNLTKQGWVSEPKKRVTRFGGQKYKHVKKPPQLVSC